jgi:hypothetical protein
MEKGDYIYDSNTGVSFIFNEWVDENLCSVFCILSGDGALYLDCSLLINPRGHANLPEIIDELDKALFKEGYYFDTDKLEMSEKRWEPETGETYYVPFSSEKTWVGDYLDLMWWGQGFVCKTGQESDVLMDISRDAIRRYLTNKK